MWKKWKNYLGLHFILSEKKVSFLFGLKQNKILFYDSFTHFLSFFVYPLFCVALSIIYFVKHRRRRALWRAFEKWIRKYFLKIRINSYLCIFCCIFVPLWRFCCWMKREIKEHIECLAEALWISQQERNAFWKIIERNRVVVSEANSIE